MTKGTNIGFMNDSYEDETQFDTTDKKELAELWFQFCKDEGNITHVEEVDIND